MRIAIPYEDGVVCQHFGKAPQFKIFDVQPQGIVESVVIDSEASGHEALAEFLATQSVQAVICGGIGQGALVSLAQSGIDVLPGVSGNPDEVIEALIAGTLQPEGNGGCGCGCGGHHHGQLRLHTFSWRQGEIDPQGNQRGAGQGDNRPLQHLRNPFQQQLLRLELPENRQGTDVSG